ncbi:Hypothetical predicted protein, partial [Marmota monax]
AEGSPNSSWSSPRFTPATRPPPPSHEPPPNPARAPGAPAPRAHPPAALLLPPAPQLPHAPLRSAALTRSRIRRRLHQSRAGGSPEQPPLPLRQALRVPSRPALLPSAPGSPFPTLFPPPLSFLPLRSLSGCSPCPALQPGRQEGGGSTMSSEGGHNLSLCLGAESGDAEPPPPPPPPPPGEPAPVLAVPRYLPPLPTPPVLPERTAGPDDPPVEVSPRRRGTDELPPPPLPLPPAGQEVSAAGDSGEGPRHLPEVSVPEAAARKGGPGEPEAGAGGEGERRGAGDQPETRSVCSSRSSSSGGGDQRAGHQHQHHQPICKICFQGAEQVRPLPGRLPLSMVQHHGQRALPFGLWGPAF